MSSTADVSAETGADAPAVVTVTYAAMNTPPTLSAAAEQTLYASALTPTVVPIMVNDAEDGPAGLTPTVTSSAPGDVTARVVRDGSGWALSLLPGNVAATATVTLSVTDPQGASSTFAVTVHVSTAGVVTTNANSGAGSLTIDGAGTVQPLYVTAPLTVTGLTFTGGHSGSYGGAIQVPGAPRGGPLRHRRLRAAAGGLTRRAAAAGPSHRRPAPSAWRGV